MYRVTVNAKQFNIYTLAQRKNMFCGGVCCNQIELLCTVNWTPRKLVVTLVFTWNVTKIRPLPKPQVIIM